MGSNTPISWGGFEVVASAATGEEAMRLCAERNPDLVLMDVLMPGLSGVEATRLVTEADPRIRVVMLTMSADDEDIFAALRNGARAYVLKDVGWARLRDFLTG